MPENVTCRSAVVAVTISHAPANVPIPPFNSINAYNENDAPVLYDGSVRLTAHRHLNLEFVSTGNGVCVHGGTDEHLHLRSSPAWQLPNP